MRKFAGFVPDEEIVQTLSALLSWSHNTRLFDITENMNFNPATSAAEVSAEVGTEVKLSPERITELVAFCRMPRSRREMQEYCTQLSHTENARKTFSQGD